jgi:hypothetical protein
MINLINITDFTENKFLTQNLDDRDIDPVITEAQEFDIKPIIGAAMYLDMMNNLTASKYIELLDGKIYTPNGEADAIYFSGLKMALKYYVYARLLVVNGVKSTNSGFVQKTLENSERISGTQLTQMIAQTRSGAKVYETEVRDFLCNYSAIYPLYCEGVRKNNGHGFRMKAI